MMPMVVIPPLKTERLTLRAFTEEDAPFVYKWCSSLKCAQYLFWYPHRSLEVTQKIVHKWVRKRRNYSWAIVLNDEPIGEVEIIKDLPEHGFEIGYILRDDMWGHGYMKEALSSVLSYMFSVGYLSCYAETDERNAASRGLLEKLGFAYEGLEENHLIEKKNEKVNLAKYRLAKEAFTCR
jgi:[ribosomal protein S5]-alanine N-acetyltransferase